LGFFDNRFNNSRIGEILIKGLVIVFGTHHGRGLIGLSFHFIHERFGFFFGSLRSCKWFFGFGVSLWFTVNLWVFEIIVTDIIIGIVFFIEWGSVWCLLENILFIEHFFNFVFVVVRKDSYFSFFFFEFFHEIVFLSISFLLDFFSKGFVFIFFFF
jgi:hypothetical protein